MPRIEYGNPGISGVKSIQYLGADGADGAESPGAGKVLFWIGGLALAYFLWRSS
jgi:hypothetical protein